METASRSISIERSLEEESPFLDHEKALTSGKRSCGLGSRTTLIFLLQALFLALLFSFLVLFKAFEHRPTDQECFTRLSVRSPATEALELYDTDFTNGFRDQSPYGGPPTPEVEARWDKLWNVGGISISEDNLLSLNRTTEGYVRFSEEKGGGYAAVIEVYHHLHCLNLLRMYTWLDHYETPPIGLDVSVDERHVHLDHCIETLRLALTCRPDVTPLLVLEDPNEQHIGAKADFYSHHKCVRFDKLSQWVDDNAAFH